MERRRNLNSVGEWCDKYHSKTKYFQDVYNGYASIIKIDKVKNRLIFSVQDREVCLGDNGYTWITFLPDNSNWCMTAIYDELGKIIEWYFDITKKNGIDEYGTPYQDDLYLDILLLPNGDIVKLDEDELQEALDNRAITRKEFNMAYEVCESLINEFLSLENKVSSFCERCFLILNEN